jgi:tripartite-type tricarboxylate transporter receptor subunit TctC
VIVENRTGASSNLAGEAVARSAPDGYTLLFVTTVNAINATFFDNLKFELKRDFAPVSGVTARAERAGDQSVGSRPTPLPSSSPMPKPTPAS